MIPEYTAFAKAFSIVINNVRFYAPQHRLTISSLENFANALKDIFDKKLANNTKNELTISFERGDFLIENEAIKNLPSLVATFNLFSKLKIDSITFLSNIELPELIEFFVLVVKNSGDIKEVEELKKIFKEKNINNIKLNIFKFAKISEDEIIQKESVVVEIEGASEKEKSLTIEAKSDIENVTSVKELDSALIEFLTGEVEEPKVKEEELVKESKKTFRKLSDLILQKVNSLNDLQNIIVKMGEWLKKKAENYEGDKPQFIGRVWKDFCKGTKKIAFKLRLDSNNQKEADGLIEKYDREYFDSINVALVKNKFPKDGKAKKQIAGMIGKMYPEKGEREVFVNTLRGEWQNAGVELSALDDYASELKEEKVKKISISENELVQLKAKAQQTEHYEKINKQLTKEKHRAEAIISNVSEGVVVVNKEGKIVFMNPAAEKLMGVNAKEKIGDSLVHNLKAEHMVSLSKNISGDKKEEIEEIELFSQNQDTKKVLRASSAVVQNEQGSAVGMVSVLSDITKQKEVEEMKNTFLSSVSHDLRSPLASVKSLLSLVVEKRVGDLNDKQAEILALADHNIDRLSRLINDLLDITKIESSKIQLKPAKINPEKIVQESIMSLQAWMEERKAKVETKFGPNLPEISADFDRLVQVMTNLLSNAVKFCKGDPQVVISIYFDNISNRINKPGIVFSVQDNGIGIAAENIKKLFNKFEMLGGGTSPKGDKGTGLGLSIVKGLVELHQGKVWIESELDKGSKFSFVIPLGV